MTALLDDAAASADRLVRHLRAQLGWLGSLPEHLGQLGDAGFRSVVGTDLPALYGRVNALRAGLRSQGGDSEGDGDAAVAGMRGALPTYRAELEGFQAYCQLAADAVARLNILDDRTLAALRDRLAATERDVTDLIAALGRLERPAAGPG